jgi:hypothetical protein
MDRSEEIWERNAPLAIVHEAYEFASTTYETEKLELAYQFSII